MSIPPDHTSRGHFEAGPSSLLRVLLCRASVQRSRGIEDLSTAAADRGERLHQLLEICLRNRRNPDDYPIDGEWAIYTPDDREAVAKVVDYVRDFLVEYPGELLVEHYVDLGHYFPGMAGTADIIIVSGRTIIVIDAKFGRVPVDATTPQLKAYGVGAVDELSMLEFDEVILAVAQPEGDNFTEIRTTPAALHAWANDVMVPGLREAFGPAPVATPTVKGCEYCRARAVCPERKAAHYDALLALDAFDPEVEVIRISVEALAAMVPYFELAKKYMGDVEAHLMREKLAGREVPGYKLIEGVSRRKWADPVVAVRELAAELMAKRPELDTAAALDAVSVRAPVNIGTAEKLIGKGSPVFQRVTVKPAGRPALVPESDKRPAYLPREALFDALDSLDQ